MTKRVTYISTFFLNFLMSIGYWYLLLAYSLVIGLDDFMYPSREAYIYSPAKSYYGLYIFVFIYITVVVLLNMLIVNRWIRKKYRFNTVFYAIIAIVGFNILFIAGFIFELFMWLKIIPLY